MSILLKNCTWIDSNSLHFSTCHILVEEGESGNIHFFQDESELPTFRIAESLDCSGKYVTKSFAVGHHHAYSALARGMPSPSKLPANFHEKLQYIWWNLDRALDADTIKASALATAIFCAKDGSTFVIDHHASPNFIKGSLTILAEAFEEVGIQHLLCYEITDRNGAEGARKGLDETAEYLSGHQGLVGLHASFTVEHETLEQASKLMQSLESGIHIHVSEDPVDQQITQQKYGKSVIQRLSEYGVLESGKSLLVHGLHLSDMERKLIAGSRAWVVQNMESNLNNKVGFFNSKGLGPRIMLGTDGMHSDMIRSAQYAWFAGQQFDQSDLNSIYSRMRNVNHYIDQNRFAGDGPNNLVILDYDGPTELNERNFLGHFFYGFHGGHVQHVISNGRFIVKDHRLTRINEDDALQFTREQGKRLWDKL